MLVSWRWTKSVPEVHGRFQSRLSSHLFKIRLQKCAVAANYVPHKATPIIAIFNFECTESASTLELRLPYLYCCHTDLWGPHVYRAFCIDGKMAKIRVFYSLLSKYS